MIHPIPYIVMLLLIGLSDPALAGAGVTYSKPGKEIDLSLRKEVHRINGEVLDAVKSRDIALLRKYMTDEFQKLKDEDTLAFINQLAPVIDQVKLTQHYDNHVTSTFMGDGHISVNSETTPRFIVIIQFPNGRATEMAQEYFISQLITSGMPEDLILTLIYKKENNKWKVNNINAGLYAVHSKKLHDWYEELKGIRESGDLITSTLLLTQIKRLIRPAPFVIYQDEKAIIEYAKTVETEFNKTIRLPYKLDVKNDPTIFHIEMPVDIRAKDFYYVIKYLSKVPLEDTVSLNKEVDDMARVIAVKFPNFASQQRQTVFLAFNEMPNDSKKSYKRFGMPRNLSELSNKN